MQRSFGVLAAAVAATVAFASPAARADQASDIAALKARVAQLEADQAKADGARAQGQAVDAAIDDANRKTRAMDAEITANLQDGFKIRSTDNAHTWSIEPYVEFQFRNVGNYNDGGDGTDENWVDGFEVRRAKFGLRGTAFTKAFSYNFRLSVDRSTGESLLDYAYGAYQLNPDYGVRFGQFKLNWTREEFLSDTKQLAAERSLLNQILGGTNSGYVQGVALYANGKGPLHGEVSFTDGDNSANTPFTDVGGGATYQDFGVAARAEYKFFGDWTDYYNDFIALGAKHDLLVAGAGVDWAEGGDGDVYRLAADVQYKNVPTGIGAYGSVLYTIADAASAQPQLDQAWGALAQVSYELPNLDHWEVFGRYDITHLDTEVNGEDNFQEITVGVNKYFVGHSAKLTVDVGYLPNGTPVSAGGLGLTNNTQDQIVVRTQFQLLL